MHWIDWFIVLLFCIASAVLGVWLRKRAGSSLEAYFVSGRRLGWWLAGTSMAATAFSSDTPLLITGIVRRRGIWGVWEVWALGLSSMLAVFVFARLWKRTGVMTEVELVERRYSGRAAAFLRGFKALYWGLFYNCMIIGMWPVTGMSKVLQETTGFGRTETIVGCVLLGALYTSSAGLWGVVLTDAFQFVLAMIGAVVLAVYAVRATGGFSALTAKLSDTSALEVWPPGPAAGDGVWNSPFGWFLGLMLIQWWAWKNTDGGGIIVQRMVSCRNERQAMLSVLWFNIAHYCLRSWPWILTAVASLVLIPDAALMAEHMGEAFVDHERAYPRLITMLLPVGLRGMLVAAFFAAFLSTISTQLNWGSSYLLHDGYRRFINRQASEEHYIAVARWLPFLLAAGGMLVAFFNQSVGASFTWILNLTAGIGPVYLMRWFWWRINSWSEIAAMSASLPVLLLRSQVMEWLGLPAILPVQLLFMVGATALIWLPATLLTAPVDRGTLKDFYQKVRPPGWWGPIAALHPRRLGDQWRWPLIQWAVATLALLATTIGPLQVLLGSPVQGWICCAIAVLGWTATAVMLKRKGETDAA